MTFLEFQSKINVILDQRGAQTLEIRWVTGGVSGGSCWDDSNPTSYHSDEEEPDFEELDKVLEIFASGISFIQYKKLMKLTSTQDHTEYEYYGNCTYSKTRSISIRVVYDFLQEHGLLE